MYHRSAHHTPKKRNIKTLLFGVLLFVCAVLAGGFFFFGERGLPPGRYVVAIFGDPLELAMFDPSRNHWTILEVPADTHMRGVQGFGDYRLDALWDVAATESSPSAVVLESLTHELGIPVTRYIAQKGAIWKKRTAPVDPLLFGVFSLWKIGQYVGNGFETNISLNEFIGISRKLWGSTTESVTQFALTSGNGLIKKDAPDSSQYLQFDQNQFDQLTGNAYEDVSIRQDGFRVAVFNTTEKPFLGSRAARILSKLGTNVVQVGNENIPTEKCQMIGSASVLSSYTAAVVGDYFDCEAHVGEEDGPADLTIKIGTEYAKK